MPPEDNPADDVPPGVPGYEQWYREQLVGRLRALLATPPLVVTLAGGGMPRQGELSLEEAVLIHRDEVATVIRLLGASPAKTD